MTDDADALRGPAAELARAVAGDDDTRFALAFQALLNQAAGFAATDDPVRLAKEYADRLTGRGAPLPVPDLYADTAYLANLREVVADRERIVGGTPTSDFPDCVAVGSATGWCCSGTLVAPDAVVTAAHCARGGCGQRVFSGEDVRAPGRVVAVREAVVHPSYGASGPHGDIAVLLLAEPLGTAPRAIAPAGALGGASFVRLVGYGNTDFQGRTGYGRRREVDVPLAGNLPGYGADPGTEFVAGAPNLDRDSCNGDSGGPAYVRVGEGWLLAGATSRATDNSVRPCGDGGIYTLVSSYAEWVGSVVGGGVR
ncbi:S1 family peptidase [Saccharothrix xinjiangensis]|uniref:S1 family peptidase n=1 Tax=Saccharothrix xinjiangensis TaxID=204798 RepID=A0ABV9XSK6_9PSEU